MRVLIMRDREDAERSVAKLARLGHEAVAAPVIAITKAESAIPAGRFDGLIATSRHAFAGGLDPARFGPGLPVFAVGRSTAEAARAAGYEDVRIGAGEGEGLSALVALTLPRPARLLYLAGRERKPVMEDSLARTGIAVDVVEVYEARPVDHWPRGVIERLSDATIDLALHYSRRSAELALALTARLGVGDAFLRLHHACLSRDVAEPLLMAEARSVAVAAEPDEESLMSLVSGAGSQDP